MCCGEPMVHNSFSNQYECYDTFAALHEQGIDPYLVEPADLNTSDRAAWEHWAASRLDDSSVGMS